MWVVIPVKCNYINSVIKGEFLVYNSYFFMTYCKIVSEKLVEQL